MKYSNTYKTLEKPVEEKKPRKRYERSLEYEVMAQLTLQNFQDQDKINYQKLLGISIENRIPALIEEFGIKRMHSLITIMIKEFCHAIKLPKSRKLNETGSRACACDLMLSAEEDQLSLEDLVLFFERAKEGKYGPFKNMLTHFSLMEKLEMYRDERHRAYHAMKQQKEAELKMLGPAMRTTTEPTRIGNLLQGNFGDYDGFTPAA
jgi:hypothetical protein